MDPKVYIWLKAGHLIGDFLWVGSMFILYWLLRFHTQAPKEAHEKLVLMERSTAMMMDIVSALAIGTGIALIFFGVKDPTSSSLLTEKPAGWLHIKLAIVVIGLLSMHGMLRAKVKKFSQGQTPSVPSWAWTVMLSAVVAIVITVFVVRTAMTEGHAAAAKAAATETAPK